MCMYTNIKIITDKCWSFPAQFNKFKFRTFQSKINTLLSSTRNPTQPILEVARTTTKNQVNPKKEKFDVDPNEKHRSQARWNEDHEKHNP